jgi:hypothetical protein
MKEFEQAGPGKPRHGKHVKKTVTFTLSKESIEYIERESRKDFISKSLLIDQLLLSLIADSEDLA